MYTLLLAGRSHVITDVTASTIRRALEDRDTIVTVGMELNGEGSGEWQVTLNLAQVIGLVAHPSTAERTAVRGLHAVPD